VEVHFSDRLARVIDERRSVVCVGLDPDLPRLPAEVRAKYTALAEAGDGEEAAAACCLDFCCGIIEATAAAAAAVKPQAAFFEQYGAAGWRALGQVIACAHAHDLLVILDVKRGDISSTGTAYARAVFGGAPGLYGPTAGLGADAVTVSPYLGDDSLTPFTDYCAHGKGVFVLTRTSNPGARLLQERISDGRAMYLHVADLVAKLGAAHVGERGYSDVGAVAGATAPEALRAVRDALPQAFLLVPGFGAQGGSAADLAGAAAGGSAGLIVNASRSILYAPRQDGEEYKSAAARAAEEMRGQLEFLL
jgi:orotidine-5'-phosphate decarboxylase